MADSLDDTRRSVREGRPIKNARALSFALMDLQSARTTERSEVWYLLNRLIRLAMEEADKARE